MIYVCAYNLQNIIYNPNLFHEFTNLSLNNSPTTLNSSIIFFNLFTYSCPNLFKYSLILHLVHYFTKLAPLLLTNSLTHLHLVHYPLINSPFLTTSFVWSDVPEAMLVRAHVASNCSAGLSSSSRHSTRIGTIPAWINSSMGGLLPLDNSFLAEKHILMEECLDLYDFCVDHQFNLF